MPSVFLCADHHFGHEKVATVFKRADGTPLRPFSSAQEMDEELVRRHNDRVRPKDKVYFLGDVVISKKHLSTLGRLNGDKVLIKGNHDIFHLEDYTPYFRDVRSYHVMNGLILSHVPIHESSLARFGCNIHGHLHANRVKRARGVDARTGAILYSDEVDPRYYNVSMEQIDYTPILFEDVQKRIVEQGGSVGFRRVEGPTVD